MAYVVLGARLVLAGVFLVSLAGKVRGATVYRSFVSATATLAGSSLRTARWLAALTVAAEAGILLGLAVPPAVPYGFGLAVVTLTGFTIALVRALRRGGGAPCHCFGASSTPIGVPHVVRNLVLTGLALAGLALGYAGGTLELAGIAVTAAAALACVAVVMRLDDLVDLFAPAR